MKVKTSVSIDDKILGKLKTLAKKENRSVSSLIEKFLSDFIKTTGAKS